MIKRTEYPNFLETNKQKRKRPHFLLLSLIARTYLCLPSAGEYSLSKTHYEIGHRRRFRRDKQQGQAGHYRAGSHFPVNDLANEKNDECQQ